jgi:hypothetical protein
MVRHGSNWRRIACTYWDCSTPLLLVHTQPNAPRVSLFDCRYGSLADVGAADHSSRADMLRVGINVCKVP